MHGGAKWEYETIGFYATEGLLWLCVVVFMAWFWKKAKGEIKKKGVKFSWTKDRVFVLSCLLFILYVFASSLWAYETRVSRQQAFRVLEGFLLFFMLYLGPLDAKGAMKAFVAGSVVPALLGVWQFVTQSTFDSVLFGLSDHPVLQSGTSVVASPEAGRWLRAYGPMSHPNVFGGYGVISFVFLLSLVSVKVKKDTLVRHVLYPAACILIVASLFFTFSRSAWIAFAIVIFLYCCVALRERSFSFKNYRVRVMGYGVLAAIVLSTLFIPLVQTRILGGSTHETRSTTERVNGYSEALDVFRSHPFDGVGVGNYTNTLVVNSPNARKYVWAYQPVHNVGLLFLAELGILGVVLLGAIMVTLFRLQKEHMYSIVLFALPLVPLLLFDHYLFSSYIGLMLVGVYWGVGLRFLETKKHSQK